MRLATTYKLDARGRRFGLDPRHAPTRFCWCAPEEIKPRLWVHRPTGGDDRLRQWCTDAGARTVHVYPLGGEGN